jgi:hypothetical protein
VSGALRSQDGHEAAELSPGDHHCLLGVTLGEPSDDVAAARWQTQLVDACDGGARYFGAEFDVESGRVVSLAFNSEGQYWIVRVGERLSVWNTTQ